MLCRHAGAQARFGDEARRHGLHCFNSGAQARGNTGAGSGSRRGYACGPGPGCSYASER